MDKEIIYVFEDYNYGAVCASHNVEVMKSKLREKYFDELLPYTIRECKANSKSDAEFEENLIEIIQEDMRMIEENLEIVDCAYVYGLPVIEEKN